MGWQGVIPALGLNGGNMTNEKKLTNQKPHQGGMSLPDIYFILFRHKWKIVTMSCLGLIAAGVIYACRSTVYTSSAEVLLKAVKDNGNAAMSSRETDTRDVLGSPDGLIMNEVAILGSYDLAVQVATNVGPARILAMYGGGDNTKVADAAALVHDGLFVERVGRSSVLKITLVHRDRDMVQQILRGVIDAYYLRHAEIHALGEAWEKLKKQSSAIRAQLLQKEQDLQAEQDAAHTVDVEGAQKAGEEQMSQLKVQLISAQSELERHRVMLSKLKGVTKADAVISQKSTNEAEIPPDLIEKYNDVVEYLAVLKRGYNEMRPVYNEHSQVIQDRIAVMQKQEELKKQMEKDEPRLKQRKPLTAIASNGSMIDPVPVEEANVAALESQVGTLQTNIVQLGAALTNLETHVMKIHDLQLDRAVLEGQYKDSYSKLTGVEISSGIEAASANNNIVTNEQPTPPAQERSRTPMMMGGAAAAGVLLGLVWAFVLEVYVDRSVKRPKEIETDLGMRLFLSIPKFKGNGRGRKALAAAKQAALLDAPLAEGAPVPMVNGNGNGNANGHENGNGNVRFDIAPWDSSHALHGYYEALRDRLMNYFDIHNLNHKPKLVAVTGSSRGCGATTIAAGLAASLSETGDGNVLLVDMNMEQGATQQFYRGKPNCELDEALENGTRDSAMIQNKLYVVNGRTNGDMLSQMLPKRFANLVPKLKASDYDYIIFDMPPIARTGVTQRLANFMDMMLLVVEAEKTSRDVVRQTGALLAESKANVSVVLNKTRNYIPERLHQEF
jgi:succinoglycan biosynthesis transport protein ExoP